MKQCLSITGQSITGQKFHHRFRVSGKSVSTPNLLKELCTSRIYAFLSDGAIIISF